MIFFFLQTVELVEKYFHNMSIQKLNTGVICAFYPINTLSEIKYTNKPERIQLNVLVIFILLKTPFPKSTQQQDGSTISSNTNP